VTVAIVVLTPPFLPTLLQSLRVLRFIRLARLLRLAPLFKLAFSFEGVRYATYFSLLVVITSSLGFESAEPNVGYLDSIYWAFGTMTTVGSGDTIPTTDEAKLLAMFVMLVGVGYFAVITGSIAQRFVAFGEEERAEERWRRAPARTCRPGSSRSRFAYVNSAMTSRRFERQ
jgi:voltage-gated potassium channel